MRKRFAVYPGDVRSVGDGQWHHVGFIQLCRLHGIDPSQAFDATQPRALDGMTDAARAELIEIHPHRYPEDYVARRRAIEARTA